MSVLVEALDLAEQRKLALVEEDGQLTIALPFQGLLLLLSGADLDPEEVASYVETIVSAFLCDIAMNKPVDVIFRGLLTEGLVTGMMIERVAQSRDASESEPEPSAEPTITGTAKTLARLLLVRAQQVAVKLLGDRA